jgi:hypothetical protein
MISDKEFYPKGLIEVIKNSKKRKRKEFTNPKNKDSKDRYNDRKNNS